MFILLARKEVLKMKNKILIIAMAVAVMATVLMGCSNDNNEEGTTTAIVSETAESTSERTTVSTTGASTSTLGEDLSEGMSEASSKADNVATDLSDAVSDALE